MIAGNVATKYGGGTHYGTHWCNVITNNLSAEYGGGASSGVHYDDGVGPAVYDELESTINSIFMYKEENAYAVARRIEDLNILIHDMRKLTRQIERELAAK